MPDWISIESYSRTEDEGRELVTEFAGEARIICKVSRSHRDVRIEGNHIVKIVLGEDWSMRRILVDDLPV